MISTSWHELHNMFKFDYSMASNNSHTNISKLGINSVRYMSYLLANFYKALRYAVQADLIPTTKRKGMFAEVACVDEPSVVLLVLCLLLLSTSKMETFLGALLATAALKLLPFLLISIKTALFEYSHVINEQ